MTHPLPGMTSTVCGVSENRNRGNIKDHILLQLQLQNAMTAKLQVSIKTMLQTILFESYTNNILTKNVETFYFIITFVNKF